MTTFAKLRSLKGLRIKGSGVHSIYFKLNKSFGLKVIFATSYWYQQTKGIKQLLCESKKQLLESPLWKEAKLEAKLMRMVQKSTYVPMAHRVIAIKDTRGLWTYDKGQVDNTNIGAIKSKGFWFPAILMDHIEGETLSNLVFDGLFTEQEQDEIIKTLGDIIKQHGITMKDLHEENIIYDQYSEPHVIDFSPGTCIIRKLNNG